MIHLRYKHTGERPYACTEPGCNKRFVQEHHMRKHAKTIHLSSIKVGIEEESTQSEMYDEIPDLLMEEVKSNQILLFPTEKLPVKRKASAMEGTLEGTIAPEKLQLEPSFICKWKKCNSSFNEMESLAIHICEHIKEQKFINKREKKKGFTCEWAGCARDKPFNSCYNLEHHIRYKHTGEKPYACSVMGCYSRFAQASDLKEHLRLHNNPIYDDKLPENHKKQRMQFEDEITERFLQNAQCPNDNLLMV